MIERSSRGRSLTLVMEVEEGALQYLTVDCSGESAVEGCMETKDGCVKRSCEEGASLSSSDDESF
jgi:hypothetical protein